MWIYLNYKSKELEVYMRYWWIPESRLMVVKKKKVWVRERERDKTDRETMNLMSTVAGDLAILEEVWIYVQNV